MSRETKYKPCCSDMSYDDESAALDFLSASFDAVKALQCSPSKVTLPHPSVPPCDNLDAYSSVVRGIRQEAPTRCIAESANGAVKKEEYEKTAKKKSPRTVFDFMEKVQAGPFSLLQRCRVAGRRVRVAIRHCAGVRGVCEGVLVVYDRHLNIVLAHVVEWCTPFRTVANGGITLPKNKRRKKAAALKQAALKDEAGSGNGGMDDKSGQFKDDGKLEKACDPITGYHTKWEVCHTMQQLFIRGDNVIHISVV